MSRSVWRQAKSSSRLLGYPRLLSSMPQLQQEISGRSGTTLRARIESSLRNHATAWMYGFLGLGFVIRVWHASQTYLNPDEVLHFLAANRPTWADMMRNQASISHPPLLIFILRFWRHLGTSELVLRMPSILAGMVFCWFAYKWFRLLLPEAAAGIAFIFVVFLPSSIDMSTEIRQYALLLAFAMGSAYYLERAFREHSAKLVAISGVFLLLAICSHYSSFLFAAAMGVYAIVRMSFEWPKRSFLATWVGVQIAALALCAFFYMFHISRMGKLYSATADATHAWMGNEYLGNSYFDPAKISAPLFIFARSGGVFQYSMGQAALGDVAFAGFLLGIFVIFRKPRLGKVSPRLLATLLLAPFVVNCAAALVRRYPYGGTRHSAFLLPFALAGVAVGLAYLCKSRMIVGTALALVVVVGCNISPSRRLPYISPQDQKREKMNEAMSFIQNQIPPEQWIYTDLQTGLMLQHYLCGARPMLPTPSPDFVIFTCGNHRVIESRAFLFTPKVFYDRWNALISEYKLAPGAEVWITQMGWSSYLARDLQKVPGAQISPIFFGERIQFFPMKVGEPIPMLGRPAA
jgi:hypothetical protein